MKKIITAINNPKLNEELKKEKNLKVIGKDIQYKEAILEILKKNNDIDLIIISEKIPGEIKLENLIKKIKLINETIKIIFILEKENRDLETILIKNNILDIYKNDEINLEQLIKIINKKEKDMQEEIIKLRRIIEEQHQFKHKNIKNKIINYKSNKTKKEKIKDTKIITFSGNYKSGKTTIALIMSYILAKYNYKVLLIDGDLEKEDLNIILNKSENKNKIKLVNKNQKTLYKDIKLKNDIKIFYNYRIKKNINKINKNIDFFCGLKYCSKNKKRLKQYIKQLFFIGRKGYTFIIIELSKNNPDIMNQEILKNSDINFILMEPNILGTREIRKLLNLYITKWKIEKDKISLIANKKNFYSLNKKIIVNLLKYKNKIYEIKENKIYKNILDQQLIRIIIANNKILQKGIEKIINKILFRNINSCKK